MKIKLSLIPFIPVTIATVAIKIMSLFGLDESGMFLGMNKVGLNYAVIGLTLGLFVVCVLINIFDRKTAPVYPVKKNPVSGILAVLSGASVAASSIAGFLNVTGDSDYYRMALITALFSIPAAIAFVLISKVHFVGKSTVSGISGLFIFPTLWGCAELVSEFLSATKVSISSSDMTALFSYIFITLYLFSHSMIVSRIKGRNPVKACFIYGLPAVAISLSYGLYVILTSTIEGFLLTNVLTGVNFIILSLYAISFIVEMFFGIVTKDEIEIIDGLPEDEDTYESSYVKSGGYDHLVFSDRKADDTVSKTEEYFSEEAGMNDFVIGFNTDDEKTDNSTAEVSVKNDIMFGVENTADEQVPEKVVTEPTETPVSTEDDAVNKRLSEIDLLLQELENKK